MNRVSLVLCAALAGCELEATIGSVRPIVLADARTDTALALDTNDEDATVDAGVDSAAIDASDDRSMIDASDARQRETSIPEFPRCDTNGQCPLGRQCSRTLCVPLWSGCDEVELCNGLDDDCDGVRDNDVDCGGGAPCPEGLTRCGANCVDLRQDRGFCGRCDRACPTGTACMVGHCR
jgi:hypothetical protein